MYRTAGLLSLCFVFALSMHGAEAKRRVAQKRVKEHFVLQGLLQSTPLPKALCELVFSYCKGACKVREVPIRDNLSDVSAMIVLSENNIAVAVGGTIRVIDVLTGECLRAWNGHETQVTALARLSKNMLASADEIGCMRIWNHKRAEQITILEGHSGAVQQMVKLARHTIASCSKDFTVKIWNYNTGECLRTLGGYTDNANSI